MRGGAGRTTSTDERATFARVLLESGEDPYSVSQALGHRALPSRSSTRGRCVPPLGAPYDEVRPSPQFRWAHGAGGLAPASAKTRRVAFQAIQITFALGIAAAFAAVQFGLTRPDRLLYLLTNLVCAAGLTVAAVLAVQLGFVISNGLWTVVAAAGLIRLARRHVRRDDFEGG